MDRETNLPESPRPNRLLFPGAAGSHASESSPAAGYTPANQDAPIIETGSAQPIARANSLPARPQTVANSAVSQLSSLRCGVPNLTSESQASRSLGNLQGDARNGVYFTTSDFSIPVFGISIAAVLNIWLEPWVCQLIAAFMMLSLGVLLLIKKSILPAVLFILGSVVIFMISLPRV